MGPLAGVRIVEFAGIGPGPFCAMMLADMGAKVIRIERKSSRGSGSKFDILARGRCSLAIDLKTERGLAFALQLVKRADALIEGFRPGVMERLKLGPDVCLELNPRLIYGRVTGWGQSGPLKNAAGHDINYIALSGALHAIGRAEAPPVLPLNLVGDFGGGGMLLAFGIVCGILEARSSGRGQVVDAAMTDGAALLMTMIYGLKAQGQWRNQRGANLLDGGAPFYHVYQCADHKYVAIGAFEPRFYELLLDKVGLAGFGSQEQTDRSKWPDLQSKLESLFKSRTRDEWCRILEGSDACFAPVLDLDEAPKHYHNAARGTFVEVEGVVQPGPAPRFSRTPPCTPTAPLAVGEQSGQALADWGFSPDEITELARNGTINSN